MNRKSDNIYDFIKIDGDKCWEWLGAKNRDGYGIFHHKRVHRLIYSERFGDIPSGKQICHKCDNPSCCNPDHLYLGDYNSNNKDKRDRGRANKKINNKQLEQIKQMRKDGKKLREIAGEFGISIPAVHYRLYPETWQRRRNKSPEYLELHKAKGE